MNNLDIWEKYRAVPKGATKAFNNGKFSGTDINTMWRIKSLTELFGPCGLGWYYKPVQFWEKTCETGDVFVFAEIELYVKYNGEWSMPISGTGGNKLQRITKEGGLSTSDEAYKMAITDALGVACKNLGFGADIYWENDRTKYTEYAMEMPIKVEAKPKTITVADALAYVLVGGKYDGQTIGQVEKVDIDYLRQIVEKAPNSTAARHISLILPQQQVLL